MAEVVDLLHRDLTGPVAVTSLRGAGGTGKTVLARQVCNNPEVYGRFPGGVFWVVLGEQPDLAAIAASLYTDLTARTAPTTTNGIMLVWDEFERIGEPCLLVVDDVWQRDTFTQFTSGLPEYVRIIGTTRGVALGGREVIVDELSAAESLEILSGGRSVSNGTKRQLELLSGALGRWALLLGLAARQLEGSFGLPQAEDAVQAVAGEILADFSGSPTVLDDPASRGRSFGLMLQRSLDQLGDGRAFFEQLAVFPPDAAIPSDLLGLLWTTTPTRTRRVVRSLRERGLIEVEGTGEITFMIRLHDLFVAWLHENVGIPGSTTLHRFHLRCATEPIDEVTLGPSLWWHYHVRHTGQWDRFHAGFGRPAMIRYRQLHESWAPLLAACRVTATKLALLSEVGDDGSQRAWLQARLCDAAIVTTLRRLPVETIVAQARIQGPLAALANVAELDDWHKPRALVEVSKVRPDDDVALQRTLLIADTLERGTVDRCRAHMEIARTITSSRPDMVHRILARELRVAKDHGALPYGISSRMLRMIARRYQPLDSHRARSLIDGAISTIDHVRNYDGERSRELAALGSMYMDYDAGTAEELFDRAISSAADIRNDHGQRCRTWSIVAKNLSGSFPDKASRAWEEAMGAAETVGETGVLGGQWVAYAARLYQAADPGDERVLERSLAAVETVERSFDKAKALVAIARSHCASAPLNELVVQRAIDIATEIEQQDLRNEVLAAIVQMQVDAAPQDPDVQRRALERIERIDATSPHRIAALAGVSRTLRDIHAEAADELLDVAVEQVGRVDGEVANAEALAFLTRELRRLDDDRADTTLHQAVAKANEIADDQDRSRRLADLAEQLATDFPEEANSILSQAQTVIDGNNGDRGNLSVALADIAALLVEHDPDRARAVYESAVDVARRTVAYKRVEALTGVADRLAPFDPNKARFLLGMALEKGRETTGRFGLRQAELANIAESLRLVDLDAANDLVEDCLATITEIDDERRRALVLMRLAELVDDPIRATELADRAFHLHQHTYTSPITDGLARTATRLAPVDPSASEHLMEKCLRLANSVEKSSGRRTRVLAGLAEQLVEPDPEVARLVLEHALAASSEIKKPARRCDDLAGLAVTFIALDAERSRQLLDQALAGTQNIDDDVDAKTTALLTIASGLHQLNDDRNVSVLRQALEQAGSLSNRHGLRARSLVPIAAAAYEAGRRTADRVLQLTDTLDERLAVLHPMVTLDNHLLTDVADALLTTLHAGEDDRFSAGAPS